MARVCDICGKGILTGHKVSHSNRKTNRRWLPNLQKVTLKMDGKNKSLKICTGCLRTYHKNN